MSGENEEKKESSGVSEKDIAENTENKNHVGGFFDSLIADFSLDDLPAPPPVPAETEPDDEPGEVVVETVDGITVDPVIEEAVAAETEPEVIFDEEAPEAAPEAPQHAMPDPEEEEEKKKGGIIAFLFPVKGDGIGEIIRKIVFLCAVCVFAVAGTLLFKNVTESEKAIEDQKKDKKIIVTTVATTIDENGEVITIPPTEEEIQQHNFSVMEYYKKINSDVIGFLELPGCDIAEPVVQTDDNEYYLKHTYYNDSNQAGSIFMDYRCTVDEDYTSPNIVLYGHNQRDGTRFGNLKRYKYDTDFYAENPVITFTTEYESAKYVIFGYFVTNTLEKQDSNKEVFHYHDYIETLANPGTFGWYMNQVRRRNQIISPVDVTYGDKLLVLSTCSNEYSDSRFAVFARKLREGETEEDFDFSEAVINQNAKGIDWNAVLSAPARATRAPSPQLTTEEESTEEETAPESDDTGTGRNIFADGIGDMIEQYSNMMTTAPDDEESSEETTKKRKKTDTASEEETTPAPDDEPSSEETTKKKKKTETEEPAEDTAETTKKKAETEEETAVTTVPESSAADSEEAETAADDSAAESSETTTTGISMIIL